MRDHQPSKPEVSGRLTSWALLILGAAVMRMAGLEYFPGVMADEGLWTSSSKNFVMFGDWFMDGRTHALLSPVFHGMCVAVYWVMGASIANARLVSALASMASVPLLYSLVHRTSGACQHR